MTAVEEELGEKALARVVGAMAEWLRDYLGLGQGQGQRGQAVAQLRVYYERDSRL